MVKGGWEGAVTHPVDPVALQFGGSDHVTTWRHLDALSVHDYICLHKANDESGLL